MGPRFTYLIPALTYHFYPSLLPDSHNLGHTFSRSQFTIVSFICVIQLLCHTFFSPAVESQTRTRWTSLYFTPVFSVLLYNVGDLVGRSTATWLKWPGRKAKERYALLVVTILRIGMKHKKKHLVFASGCPRPLVSSRSRFSTFARSNRLLRTFRKI